MEEKLFEGAGNRIKTLAKVLFILGIIASIILAIVFGWDRYLAYGKYKHADFVAWKFFLFLIGGPIITYINTLLLYGYGELIEETSRTRSKTNEIEVNTKGIKGELDSVEKEIKSIPDVIKALKNDETT